MPIYKCENCGKELDYIDRKTIDFTYDDKYHILYLCNNCYKTVVFKDVIKKHLTEFENKKTEQKEQEQEKKNIEEAELQKEENLKKEQEKALSNFMITTTNSFEGYRVVEYLGICIGTSGVKSDKGATLAEFKSTLSGIKGDFLSLEAAEIDTAIKHVKNQSVRKGANACIGLTVGMTYDINRQHIYATGTAVRIEKIEENKE